MATPFIRDRSGDYLYHVQQSRNYYNSKAKNPTAKQIAFTALTSTRINEAIGELNSKFKPSECLYKVASVLTLGLVPLVHRIYDLVRRFFDTSDFFQLDDLNIGRLESSKNTACDTEEELPTAHLNLSGFPGGAPRSKLPADRKLEAHLTAKTTKLDPRTPITHKFMWKTFPGGVPSGKLPVNAKKPDNNDYLRAFDELCE